MDVTEITKLNNSIKEKAFQNLTIRNKYVLNFMIPFNFATPVTKKVKHTKNCYFIFL